MFLHRVVFLIATALAVTSPALLAQAPAAPAVTTAENLTEPQKELLKELDVEFDRLDAFIASLPDSQPKLETKRVLETMRKRALELRASFDQTRYDETRWETNFEHQQLLLYLQPLRVPPPSSAAAEGLINQLTPMEKSSGWELLFDGKTLTGWRGYRLKGPPPAGWAVTDGTLRTAGKNEKGVDLVTERKFSNFELAWEWRVTPGASNGIKYFVTEDRPTAQAHEYLLQDDSRVQSSDQRGAVRRTGAFFDVVPPSAEEPARPVGEWNRSRLLVAGNRVEHWLNGRNILTYEVGSAVVKKGIAISMFKDVRGFGEKITGPLLITYHPTETWFRNIKVRELK